MKLEWVRRGTWALCIAAWLLAVVDALPWGWDFDGGAGGLARVVAIVTTAVLYLSRPGSQSAVAIYQAGWEQGRRSAMEQLRSGLDTPADR